MLDDFPDLPWHGQYVLGGEEGHTPVPCYSMRKWGQMLASMDRRVAFTGTERKYVSTVFLGLDHRHFGGGPPIVFESMLFINGSGEDTERYSSWDDAEIGHKAMVRKHLINPKTRVKTETTTVFDVPAIENLVETLAKKRKPE